MARRPVHADSRRNNLAGLKGNKGGKKRRNKLHLDISAFARQIEMLDEAGGNVEEVITEILENAGEDIGVRTKEAMDAANLPAKGKYATPETIDSVIESPRAEWTSTTSVEIGVGFDKLKPGTGGLLITGTPKMEPNYALEKIYVNKKYQKELMKQIGDDFATAISEKLEG